MAVLPPSTATPTAAPTHVRGPSESSPNSALQRLKNGRWVMTRGSFLGTDRPMLRAGWLRPKSHPSHFGVSSSTWLLGGSVMGGPQFGPLLVLHPVKVPGAQQQHIHSHVPAASPQKCLDESGQRAGSCCAWKRKDHATSWGRSSIIFWGRGGVFFSVMSSLQNSALLQLG